MKTNYSTTSVRHIPRHPAYDSEDMPTRILQNYIEDPANQETWASPEALAAAFYEIVSRGQPIPQRHVFCPEAYAMLKAEIPKYEQVLEDSKELAFKVGKEGQLESLAFMN